MKNIIYVYELFEDQQVFYIGLTKNPKMRLRHHQRNYGEDISMRLFYATWDIDEANRVEVERISETDCLDNVALGGGYGPRFYKQTKINTEINGDNPVMHNGVVDSYFPFYHSILRATHIKNITDGTYVSLSPLNKVVMMYFLDRYKFFRDQGKQYFDNQEEIAQACGVVRKSVFNTIKTMSTCGYLNVGGKMSFCHRSNNYKIVKEFQLAVIKEDVIIEEFGTRILYSSKFTK
jgi:hypothetical protein